MAHYLFYNLPKFRKNGQSNPVSQYKNPKLCVNNGKSTVCMADLSRPGRQCMISRRDLMFLGLSSSLYLVLPTHGAFAEEDLKMDVLVDDINAYSYLYPTKLPSQNFVFKWVKSRKPELYSSAAPLSPDARLRIVSERVDFVDNLIISVSIGPPNALFLKSKDKNTWNAKDVADSVLANKSALRVTSSQRQEESSLLDAHSSTVDGVPYWYYEYLVRKSPTQNAQESKLYRHFVASTSERDGFLYTLSASTLSKQWENMTVLAENSGVVSTSPSYR